MTFISTPFSGKFDTTPDYTFALNKIREIVDQIIYCDSVPVKEDRIPDYDLVIDEFFYEELMLCLPSYLSVYRMHHEYDKPLQLFWHVCHSLGFWYFEDAISLEISTIRTLVENIASQAVHYGITPIQPKEKAFIEEPSNEGIILVEIEASVKRIIQYHEKCNFTRDLLYFDVLEESLVRFLRNFDVRFDSRIHPIGKDAFFTGIN